MQVAATLASDSLLYTASLHTYSSPPHHVTSHLHLTTSLHTYSSPPYFTISPHHPTSLLHLTTLLHTTSPHHSTSLHPTSLHRRLTPHHPTFVRHLSLPAPLHLTTPPLHLFLQGGGEFGCGCRDTPTAFPHAHLNPSLSTATGLPIGMPGGTTGAIPRTQPDLGSIAPPTLGSIVSFLLDPDETAEGIGRKLPAGGNEVGCIEVDCSGVGCSGEASSSGRAAAWGDSQGAALAAAQGYSQGGSLAAALAGSQGGSQGAALGAAWGETTTGHLTFVSRLAEAHIQLRR